jgi:hypothetical protein
MQYLNQTGWGGGRGSVVSKYSDQATSWTKLEFRLGQEILISKHAQTDSGAHTHSTPMGTDVIYRRQRGRSVTLTTFTKHRG